MRMIKYIQGNFTFLVLALVLLFSLFNPVFKKYDYGSEWLSVLAFCIILPLLYVVDRRYLSESRNLLFSKRLEKTFSGLFVIFMALSFAYSQTRNVGLSEVMAYLSGIGVYFLLAHRRLDFGGRLVKVIVLATLGAVLMGIVLYIFREEPRMFGPFFNLMHYGNLWPNAFAVFLLMAWPLFLITRYRGLLPFVFVALLLTFSRGALIAFGGQLVLLAIYWFFLLRRKDCKAILRDMVRVFMVMVATILLFFGLNSLRALNNPVINIEERATFQNSESLTSKQERIDFWQSAIELAKEKPLFGWGPFSFRYANYPIQKTFLGSSDHPHNILLKFAAENGVVVAGSFLAFIIVIFVTALRRFGVLERKERMKLVVLGVGVLGALAHSMIDYNFNFLVNLLLFFVLLGLMRGLVSGRGDGRKEKHGFPIGVFLMTIMLAMWAIYELGLGTANKLSDGKNYLDQSFYPRNHFLNRADSALADKDYETALRAANEQIELNGLDAQAWYLRGVIYCKSDFALREDLLCREALTKALAINPMNDFNYYTDYIRVTGDKEAVKRAEELLNLYFGYVENNVHFTAFTPNVEAAAALVDEIIPYLDRAAAAEIKLKKEQMLNTAKRLREESNKIL